MATYQGQSLMNYPDSFGQYYQSTITPTKQTTGGGWQTTKRTPISKVPDNYYNYHNSLYESSTHNNNNGNGNTEEDFEYYYDDNNSNNNSKQSGNTVRPRPSKIEEQFSNYENLPSHDHDRDEETSAVYPDYYETAKVVKSKPKPSSVNRNNNKVHRKKMGKLDDENDNPDYYDYHENGENNLDQRIRNIGKNEEIFR
jgi:hypothetical protein